jgi:hypothetical protein
MGQRALAAVDRRWRTVVRLKQRYVKQRMRGSEERVPRAALEQVAAKLVNDLRTRHISIFMPEASTLPFGIG